MEEVTDICNLLFNPGNLYKIHKPINELGPVLNIPEYISGDITPIIPVEFIKIYSDGHLSQAGITPDGRVYIFGLAVSVGEKYPKRYTGKYKIIEPPEGEKLIDVSIYKYSIWYTCILLSNTGKCYFIGYNANKVFDVPYKVVSYWIKTPKEVFHEDDMPPKIRQIQLDIFRDRFLMLTDSKELFVAGNILDVTKDVESSNIFYASPVKVSNIKNVTYLNIGYEAYTYDNITQERLKSGIIVIRQ